MELIIKKIKELEQELFADPATTAPQIDIPESEFGDYAVNVAFSWAKKLKQEPIKLAEDLVDKLKEDKELSLVFKKIEAISPGFINFHLSDEFLTARLNLINKKPDNYGANNWGDGKLAIVEYFQLNVAKPPHVGHLRSAVIGDSLKRILVSQGYKTVSDTHVGDWGTQFGILIWAYKNLDGRKKVKNNPLEELNQLYIEANKQAETDPTIKEAGKQEFVKLEQGDKENKKLWEFFVSLSRKEFKKMLEKLELRPFEYDLGESFYQKYMGDIIEKLEAVSLLKIGETGEKYIDLEKYNLGRLICIKSDGGTTYELRDLATLMYRYQVIAKKEDLAYNLYVVDNRQKHDLSQVFKTMELLGYDVSKSHHVDFGFMSLPEGAISTRKGTAISLDKLLEEAENRILKIIETKNPDLKNKKEVAEKVALGAVKYGDLTYHRKSDVTFDWEQALSFEGNTGPYLQYTHARLKSILRKSDLSLRKLHSFTPEELPIEAHDLVRKMVHFPEILKKISEDFTPHHLAQYLYEVTSLANSFYQSVPVLATNDSDVRKARLGIVYASAIIIKNGLYLLGIDAPEEM